jgi:hypothetical protein
LRRLVNALLRSLLVVLLAGGASLPAAQSEDNPPIITVRLKDEITMHARLAYLTFTETIVVAPAEKKEDRPVGINIAHLLIAPMWLKDGTYEGAAFPVLRPQLNLSSGRVRRFALVRPDGEAIRTVQEITPDCRYLLTIDFGHMLPDRVTVTVQMSSPTGMSSGAEISYQPSNDGHPRRPGAAGSNQTVAHIIADEPLEGWIVTAGDRTIPRKEAWVTLERDVSHTIRFGPRS